MPNIPALSGCTPLSSVEKYVDAYVDLVGVVADFRPPMSSRGTDWTVTFKICDPSCPDETSSISIRVFKPTVEQLPQIQSQGDIIIMRSVKIKYYGSKLFAISSYNTSWVICYVPTHPSTAPLITTFPITTGPKQAELQHMKALRTWWSSIGGATSSGGVLAGSYQSAGPPVSTYQSAGSQSGPYQHAGPLRSNYQNPGSGVAINGNRKFALIRDMQFNNFYDLVGLVVKKFSGVGNYTIYITDYSKNPMLHSHEWFGNSTDDDDDDGYTSRGRARGNVKWPGPWGQYTLQVTLWDGHAIAARQMLYEGAYVGLRNVRAKRNGDGKLEGAMHGDRACPDRADIYLIPDINDSRVTQVIQRCREYTRRFENDKDRYEQEAEVKAAEAQKKETRETEKKKREEQGNKNVRCQKPSHPLTSISQILDLTDITTPFVNRNYHIFCRVIDYLPQNLEDFSVPSENLDKDHYETSTKAWVWRFALLVEGNDGASMRLIVEGKDADHLLNSDAVDLRKDNRALRNLREKLFVLWGNLEECNTQRRLKADQSRKRKRPRRSNAKKRCETDELGKQIIKNPDSNPDADDSDEDDEDDEKDSRGRGKMFHACVKEYGVQVGDSWKRVHKLFGTVIL